MGFSRFFMGDLRRWWAPRLTYKLQLTPPSDALRSQLLRKRSEPPRGIIERQRSIDRPHRYLLFRFMAGRSSGRYPMARRTRQEETRRTPVGRTFLVARRKHLGHADSGGGGHAFSGARARTVAARSVAHRNVIEIFIKQHCMNGVTDAPRSCPRTWLARTGCKRHL
jgi:hypothetical protein